MRFHLPFDDVQWSAAVALHSRLVAHRARLRRDFPPHTGTQRELLTRYRQIARDFRRALLMPRDRIDADRLNGLVDSATQTAVAYMVADDEEQH
jgi:hypothetical protein